MKYLCKPNIGVSILGAVFQITRSGMEIMIGRVLMELFFLHFLCVLILGRIKLSDKPIVVVSCNRIKFEARITNS